MPEKEDVGQFRLSSEAAEKMGINEAQLETQHEKSEEGTGATVIKADVPEVTPEKGNDEAGQKPTGEELPKGQSSSSDEKELSEKEKETKADEKKSDEEKLAENSDAEVQTFNNQVIETLTRLDFSDKGKQEKLLKDLENHEKFMASNTQEAMKIAQLSKQLGTDNIEQAVTALNEIKAKEDNDFDEFLNQSDSWFDDKDAKPENNPVRQLIEAITGSFDANKAYNGEVDLLSDERMNINLQQEILSVKIAHPDYNQEEKLNELAEVADKHNTNLETAHLIMSGMNGQTEITSLNEKIVNLEKELKDKTTALTAQEKIYKPGASDEKDGPRNFVPDRDAKSGPNWDATRSRLSEKLA